MPAQTASDGMKYHTTQIFSYLLLIQLILLIDDFLRFVNFQFSSTTQLLSRSSVFMRTLTFNELNVSYHTG